MPYIRIRFVAALLLALGLGLFSAACGGEEPPMTNTDPTGTDAAAVPTLAEPAPEGVAPADEPTPAAQESHGVPPTAAPVEDAAQLAEPVAADETADTGQYAVINQGFVQQGKDVAYGLVIQNQGGAGYAAFDYTVSALDASRAVLGVDTRHIPELAAGASQGVAGTISVPEGAAVSGLDVQFTEGFGTDTIFAGALAADRQVFFPAESGGTVTARVTSSNDSALDNVRVAALAYDEAGAITGAGHTTINFLPAGGATGVAIPLRVAGPVQRVELVPALTAEPGPVASRPEDAAELELLAAGFGGAGTPGYGLLVRNPNPGYAVESSRYRLTAYDAQGNIVATHEGTIGVALPNQTLGVAGTLFPAPGAGPVARVEAQVQSGSFAPAAARDGVMTGTVAFLPGETGGEIAGELISPFSADLLTVPVAAIAYNPEGAIVGGGLTTLALLPGGGMAEVRVPVSVEPTLAIIELYALPATLAEIGP